MKAKKTNRMFRTFVHNKGNPAWRVVKGEPVDTPFVPGAFAYRRYVGNRKRAYWRWYVIEPITGLSMGNNDTKEGAVSYAKNFVDAICGDAVRARIIQNLLREGRLGIVANDHDGKVTPKTAGKESRT